MGAVKSGDLPTFASQHAFEGKARVAIHQSSASSTAGAFLFLQSTSNRQHSICVLWKKLVSRLTILYVIIFVFVSPLCAEDSDDTPIQLDEVVSATRQTTALEQTSAFGQVVSPEELNRTAASALDEVLQSVRHLQIHSYGPGSLSSLRMRGAASEQVLILIDGERLNNAQSGGMDLSQILLNGVHHVEVIRGGQSALYGADAMGGIVYIATRIPQQPQLVLGSATGSFGLQQWHADASTGWGAFRFGANYSTDQADGDFEYLDLYGNKLTRTNAEHTRQNARAQLKWTGVGMLQITAEHFDSEQGAPGPIGQVSELAYQKDLSNGIRLRWAQDITRRFSYRVNTHLRHRNLHYYDPEPFYINSLHKLDSAGVEAQAALRWHSSLEHPLIFGSSVRRDEVESSAVGARDRNAISFYAQQEWSRNNLYVFPAARLDAYSDFDAGLSPKLGLRYEILPDVSLKGNVGRSYRAPALNDLYWPEDAFTKGNPDLQAERSNDMDLGIQARTAMGEGSLSGSVVFFHSQFENRILWAPVEGGKWMPSNLADAVHQGVELEGRFRYMLFDLDAGYTFLDATDSNDKALIYTAQHTVKLNARVEHGIFWGQWSSHYESKRYTTRSNTRFLDPYLKHDILFGIHKDVGGHVILNLTAEVRNLFDTDYLLVKDYPLPGREARLKASIQLGGNP